MSFKAAYTSYVFSLSSDYAAYVYTLSLIIMKPRAIMGSWWNQRQSRLQHVLTSAYNFGRKRNLSWGNSENLTSFSCWDLNTTSDTLPLKAAGGSVASRMEFNYRCVLIILNCNYKMLRFKTLFFHDITVNKCNFLIWRYDIFLYREER